jgi:hypothetical protein
VGSNRFRGAVSLFTKDAGGLPFDGAITSLLFSYGTFLSGPAQFNVYFNAGGTDYLVASGEDRMLAAVPELSAIILLGIAAAGLSWRQWPIRRSPCK